MRRASVAILLALSLLACGPAGPRSASHPSPASRPPPAAGARAGLPSPSANPSYPPRSLADVAGLAERGLNRRLVGMEDGVDQGCGVAFVKMHELDGTPPQQVAEDLLQMAVARHVFTSGCGGFVYGTVHLEYCNCYLGDHGLLTVELGSLYQLPPTRMKILFQVTDTGTSPADWEVDLPAPA